MKFSNGANMRRHKVSATRLYDAMIHSDTHYPLHRANAIISLLISLPFTFQMRHTGVKPYECRVCQKRFFRKDHLAEHFTTHSKTLPYHCPICNRGFQRQIAMRAHFQNEHVGQHDMVKSCPLCNYRAATMKCLRLHFFNR